MSKVIVKQFESNKLETLKKHFTRYGTITKAAKKTKIYRATITRAIEKGEASSKVVDKLEKYADSI